MTKEEVKIEETFHKIQKLAFWREKKILSLFGLAFAFNIITFFYILIHFRGSEGTVVPLSYDIFLAVKKIGRWQNLLKIPLTGFLIGLVNFYLGYKIYLKEKKLTYFLSWTTLFFSFLLLLASLLIIYL